MNGDDENRLLEFWERIPEHKVVVQKTELKPCPFCGSHAHV